MNVEFIDTGHILISDRVLNDGVYLISSKISPKSALCVKNQSLAENTKLINESLLYSADQFFIFKYNEENDYYTIIALHSHQTIGVQKKYDSNYSNSNIIQLNASNDKLFQWEVQLYDNKYYTLKLKNTDYMFEYNKKNDQPILNPKNDNDNQLFIIKPYKIINNNFYYIIPKNDNNLNLTFSKNSQDIVLAQSEILNQENNHIFYIVYDQFDGCYFIINIMDMKCISSLAKSKVQSYVQQNSFIASDYQKWIIGAYSPKSGYYFIENKVNSLRFDINKVCNNSLIFGDFNPIKSNQFFTFKRTKIKQVKKLNKIIEDIENDMIFKYLPKIDLTSCDIFKWDLFEYCYLLTELYLPISLTKIPKNALANCKRIKAISCDPKWLKLLPNPLNVENIIVPQGVCRIEQDSFKKVKNLKVLVLPDSLNFDNCDLDTFDEIYNLLSFEGDPIFLKIIHKLSLKFVFIPSYVKEIPKEAFIGCKYLQEVKIEDNSNLKIIKSKAFVNCHSLVFFNVPESVEDIAPDAFDGCHDNFDLQLKNENQRFSMVQSLIIKPEVTTITAEYKKFHNIQTLEIPLSVTECEPDVLDSFEYITFVKCEPKWLIEFNIEKIQGVFIPFGVTEIKEKDFKYMTKIKFLEIPKSVENIEENAFNACENLVSVKCALNHLHSLNRSQIKTLIINDNIRKIYRNSFEGFINLENLELPESIEYISPNTFIHCKKLMNVNTELAEQLINNKISVDDDIIEICKDDFEGWVNLQFLELSNSLQKIEEGTFNDCVNITYLKCDPKWFSFIPKNSIREVEIPDFVNELTNGQFDGFNSLSKIILPKNIKIDNNTIFDSCKCLVDIKCNKSLFKKFSKKTRERCTQQKVQKLVKPIYNFQPNKKKVHNEIEQTYKSKPNSNDDEEDNDQSHEANADDLIDFDRRYDRFKVHINRVYDIINGVIPSREEPANKILKEISIVCGSICKRIKNEYNIVPKPVQVFAILYLSDEILNNRETKGAIGEIKTGEGKTLIISIVTLILVKYKHKVDVITSNMELANRDQYEQSKYFSLFNIQTGVLYQRHIDEEFIASGSNIFSSNDVTSPYSDFNISVLNNPVVYSTHSNFEFLYMCSLYENVSTLREFDIVLVDEVDNMFIDKSKNPSMISIQINYAYSRDIFEIVFQLQCWDTSEIIKVLKHYLPNAGEYKEKDIEQLKNAALKAINAKKGVEYIVENDEIVLIDQNTGFKQVRTIWSGFIHEMIQIKEGIEPKKPSIPFCQINNYAYIKLYNRIAGVTGTIGSEDDEEVISKGYNVNIFKVPRNKNSLLEVFIKRRPDDQPKLVKQINKEILNEVGNHRPVLVICDSIYHADQLFENLPSLKSKQKITAVVPENDRNSILNAGIAGTVTIATSAAGRGVDIKLTQESLENGGLHVIIPYKMRNQRALEQAVGRAARQGQPGSVTLFISENDKYEKPPLFSSKDENLINIQRSFWDHIKSNFPWLYTPKKYTFKENPILPYAADYSVVMKILGEMILFQIPKNPITLGVFSQRIYEVFTNCCMEMVVMSWANFFDKMCNDTEHMDDENYYNEEYQKFLKEFSTWFSPNFSSNVVKAFLFLNARLEREKGLESVIVHGIKISSLVVSVVFPEYEPIVKLVNGIVLHGGLSVYHALQNGDKVKWNYVLASTGISVMKVIICEKYSITSSIILGISDAIFEEIDSYVNVRKRPKFPPLPTSIRAFTEATSIYVVKMITEKLPPPSPVKPLNFKPKIIVPQLDVNFIKKTMKIANAAYDGVFESGKILISSTINEKFIPHFYCIEENDTLYVSTRGSQWGPDWGTNLYISEQKVEINGIEIYIHGGFYNAANYILEIIDHLLTDEKYQTIYFVGHSLAASVSTVLCLLTKGQERFKDKQIFAMCYAPAPSISACPSYISKCIFAFIHRYDVVPHCSFLNIINSISVWGHGFITKFNLLVNRSIKMKALCAAIFSDKQFDSIVENIGLYHVKNVKGVIFAFGLNKSNCLYDCRIYENDLPDTIPLTIFGFKDHLMNNYIKDFENFTF